MWFYFYPKGCLSINFCMCITTMNVNSIFKLADLIAPLYHGHSNYGGRALYTGTRLERFGGACCVCCCAPTEKGILIMADLTKMPGERYGLVLHIV